MLRGFEKRSWFSHGDGAMRTQFAFIVRGDNSCCREVFPWTIHHAPCLPAMGYVQQQGHVQGFAAGR